jgi:hypothetical protein
MKPVTIIVLTWNGLHYTKRCLETLRAHTRFSEFDVVVADNGSTDGTLEYLRQRRWITLVENGGNLGFAKGNNCALRLVPPGRDVLLLNNDTEVHQPDWLERLQLTAYSRPDIGLVGCRLRREDGTFQHAGAYMPLETYWGQQIGGGEKDINQCNADRDVHSVVFACVYIKREVLDKIGLLNEQFFSYFEDTDYCLRARESGYSTVCCGSVTLIHHENVSTKVNGVSHGNLFLESQATFKKTWHEKLAAKRYTRQLGWHTLFNFPTGYAISSRQMALALDERGVELKYRYLYGPGTVFPIPEPEASEDYLINIIRARPLDRERVQVVYGQGDMFHANFGRYKIGFTMLETTQIPSEWVRQANLMDEVWVPSTFNLRTFQNSGVKRPIHVIPLGVDTNYFNPGIVGHPINDVFSFLSVFEWGERKAPEIMLKAFNDEFRANEPVVLICKTLNNDAGVDLSSQVEKLRLRRSGGRIVFSVNEVVPTYQLGVLYRSADCFVLATRGEGWGMPILEAMACGLPVIATNWSAHCDFMHEDNAFPVEVEKLVPAEAKCPYYKGFQWAQPSYEHLRQQMRYVFEHQDEAREKGLRAASEMQSNWTWGHSAEKIIARLEELGESGLDSTALRQEVLSR